MRTILRRLPPLIALWQHRQSLKRGCPGCRRVGQSWARWCGLVQDGPRWKDSVLGGLRWWLHCLLSFLLGCLEHRGDLECERDDIFREQVWDLLCFSLQHGWDCSLTGEPMTRTSDKKVIKRSWNSRKEFLNCQTCPKRAKPVTRQQET